MGSGVGLGNSLHELGVKSVEPIGFFPGIQVSKIMFSISFARLEPSGKGGIGFIIYFVMSTHGSVFGNAYHIFGLSF